MNSVKPYKEENPSYEKRREKYLRINSLHPDKIPVICEMKTGTTLKPLDKKMYLVPNDFTG